MCGRIYAYVLRLVFAFVGGWLADKVFSARRSSSYWQYHYRIWPLLLAINSRHVLRWAGSDLWYRLLKQTSAQWLSN
jgi:hypothetical protein